MHPHSLHPHTHRVPVSFDAAPLRVYWEVTRACGLACRHCRAEASPHADPEELDTAQGRALLARLAQFGDPPPHVIFTGGDPLERADLWELIAHAQSLGLHVSVSPSATPRLDAAAVHRLHDAGVEAISLSIDGRDAARHDGIRGVPGCFDRTLAAARAASEASLMVQVNTLVAAETVDDLPAIHALVTSLGVARWSLFFLVSVGRGSVLEALDPARAEQLLEWLAGLPRGDGSPIVTTTEAPQYRRVMLQKHALPLAGPQRRAGFGVRDGNGVMFISHTGEVTPSGFLPASVGNVRRDDVVALYRDAPLFRSLRQAPAFGGRCGVCEYHAVCGGSRARAFAATGDPLAEDPLCTYEPAASRAAS